jgi:hypothetical protein
MRKLLNKKRKDKLPLRYKCVNLIILLFNRVIENIQIRALLHLLVNRNKNQEQFQITYNNIKRTNQFIHQKTIIMKKFVYLFSAITLIASVSLVSCTNSTEDDTTKDEAKKDTVVIEEKTEVRVATSEEWAAYKADVEAKIDANEKRIVELKAKINKPGKLLDKARAERIEALEERNRNLRLKITAYETNKTDWEKFKEEVNHDLDELGKAINDIFTDNK